MVKDIESFRPELQASGFTEPDNLGHGEVKALGRWSIDNAAATVPNNIRNARRGRCRVGRKARGIEVLQPRSLRTRVRIT